MATKSAGYSMRVWVSNDDLEKLKRLSDETQLSQVELMTRIMHSGLKAIVQNDYRLTLPLAFNIAADDGAYPPHRSQSAALNETRPRSKK